jgi:hypothetical protein
MINVSFLHFHLLNSSINCHVSPACSLYHKCIVVRSLHSELLISKKLRSCFSIEFGIANVRCVYRPVVGFCEHGSKLTP